MVNCKIQQTKFCFCFSLRNGCYIIGCIGWVFTLMKLFGVVNPIGITKQTLDKNDTTVETRDTFMEPFYTNNLGVNIGYALIALIISIFLIYGAYKKDYRFVVPYVIDQCIECLIVFILAIDAFVRIFLAKREQQKYAIILFFIIFLSGILFCYFWLCVWSYYKELHDIAVAARTAKPKLSISAGSQRNKLRQDTV